MNRDDEIFAEALDLPAAARAAFLDRACAGDPAQRGRLEALLAGHDAANSFLSRSPLQRPATPLVEKPGDVIGRYTLLRKIGEGGCGIVYLAEQKEPVRRQVALKVIKLGMDTREVITRFEAERQALAMMDHPDIARVFDAGTTGAGRPFFVMEFVDGVPITKFCDDQNLPMPARLELFARVCHAVQHAHQKGIIHRDLKPSNILVARHGDRPAPKVIDFGIAKATQGRLTDATLATAVEQFIGTPAYMSPEQAEVSSVDIDTRSDIYSLGVLLYELLTGRTPFEPAELMQIGLDEMRRHIREVDPPRPSTRLHTLEKSTLATTAGHRQIAAPKLITQVQGDLDWIVMRCLEKDRTRRYETAASLAQDLQRHLDHEPVEARPVSAAYRFRKLVRRNRLAFGAAAGIAVALIAGLVASTWQAVRASRAERAAQNEAAISKAVNEFLMTDLLRQADSFAQAKAKDEPNPGLKVSEALDRAAEKVGARFRDQPLVEAAVRFAIAESYEGLGLPDKAKPQLERAAELRRRLLGLAAIDTLETLGTLVVVLNQQGSYAAAEKLARETLEIRQRTFGREHVQTAKSLDVLGEACDGQGKYAEAVALRREALQMRQRLLGPEAPDTLETMNNLGESLRQDGKFAAAEALHRETLAIKKRVLGPEHPLTLFTINNLAVTLDDQGKLPEALELRAQLVETSKRVFGPEHPEALNMMHNLASAYRSLNRFDEAIALYRTTLELLKKVRGPEHPRTITAMNNLAETYSGAARYDEAIALFEPTLVLLKRTMGPEHPFTLSTMNNLAAAYGKVNRPAEAAALHEQTLAVLRKVLGPEHPNVFGSMNNLAVIYVSMGKVAEAIALHEPATAGMKRVLGPEHPSTLTLMVHLGNEYAAANRPDDALAVRRELYPLQQRVFGPDDVRTRATQALLLTALLAAKQFAEAEPALREMLAYREKHIPDDWTTFNTRSALGGALLGQRKYTEAEPLLVSGYEGMVAREAKIAGPSRIRISQALERLVQFYTEQGPPEKAAAWQQKLDERQRAADTAAPPPKP